MHEIVRMHFSSRTLKIVATFLDRGSVTKKKYENEEMIVAVNAIYAIA